MKVENPVALRFVLQDELYLLNADKNRYAEHIAPTIEKVEIAQPVIAVSPEPPLVALVQPQSVTISAPQPVVETPKTVFNYLGKNLKNFLVLVHYPELEFIDEAHLIALTNIIKRKELGVDDIAILNLAKHAAHLDELKEFFKPTKILVLGNPAIPKGMPTLILNAITPADGFAALHSFSFGEMMDNTDKKKAFWEQMKSL